MVFLTDELTAQIKALKMQSVLPPPPPLPRLPQLSSIQSNYEKVYSIQRFIESFEYNHTGQPFVRITKSRGMSNISLTSKEIIRTALPIQCVEAVFLGCFLSAGMIGTDRIPLSFKSKLGDHSHRHIVLVMRIHGKWGSIGISRRSNLMNKDFVFNSFLDLIEDYKLSYRSCFHRLVKVYIGLPFPHDIYSDVPIKWRALTLKVSPFNRPYLQTALEEFVCNMNKYLEKYLQENSGQALLQPKHSTPTRSSGITYRNRSTQSPRPSKYLPPTQSPTRDRIPYSVPPSTEEDHCPRRNAVEKAYAKGDERARKNRRSHSSSSPLRTVH